MSISNLVADNKLDINCASVNVNEKSSLPRFRAQLASASIAASSGAVIGNYDSVVGDLADGFNTTTGLFTMPFDGALLMSARVFYSAGAPSAASALLTIRKNSYASGNIIQCVHPSYAGGEVCPTASGILHADQGDVIGISLYQSVGSPLAVTAIELVGVAIHF